MKISLITTVKNEERTIRALIEAVGSQTRKPDEWVVVDGGSTDRTVEILRAETSCITLVEPGSIPDGRNRAIALATGDLIVVADAGTRPCPNWLESLAFPLEHRAGDFTAGPTVPRIESPWDAAQWTLFDQLLYPTARWRQPTVSSRSMAFFRKVWKECPYPEGLVVGEDRWLAEQWLRRGKKMVWVEDAQVEWTLRPTLWAFIKQHFLYMRGDGQGNMRPKFNLLRIVFYLGLVLLIASASGHSAAGWCALFAWLAYLGATLAARFPAATKGRSLGFRLLAFAYVPLALVAMDLAKIAGYLLGTLERLSRNRYTPQA